MPVTFTVPSDEPPDAYCVSEMECFDALPEDIREMLRGEGGEYVSANLAYQTLCSYGEPMARGMIRAAIAHSRQYQFSSNKSST